MNIINFSKLIEKVEELTNWEEVIKKNKENSERIRKERLEANKKVVKNVKRTSNKK